MIEWTLRFKFCLMPLGKSKWKVLYPVVTTSLLSPMSGSIVIITLLNYCKAFCWFSWVVTKDIIFVWFRFWVCMNYFQLLIVLIILKIWFIVFLELRFWFQFLFFCLFLFWDIIFNLSAIASVGCDLEYLHSSL